jgi:hypothetical protein
MKRAIPVPLLQVPQVTICKPAIDPVQQLPGPHVVPALDGEGLSRIIDGLRRLATLLVIDHELV